MKQRKPKRGAPTPPTLSTVLRRFQTDYDDIILESVNRLIRILEAHPKILTDWGYDPAELPEFRAELVRFAQSFVGMGFVINLWATALIRTTGHSSPDEQFISDIWQASLRSRATGTGNVSLAGLPKERIDKMIALVRRAVFGHLQPPFRSNAPDEVVLKYWWETVIGHLYPGEVLEDAMIREGHRFTELSIRYMEDMAWLAKQEEDHP